MVVFDRVPEVPVTVTVTAPVVAVELAVSVSVLVVAVGFGLKAAVTPSGSPEAESPHGTVIAIDAEVVGAQARISVVDQGPGIPDDRQHELFRKFARLGAQSPGTGLGLFISRGIARAHGGELSYEANPDGGARFTLALPLG